MVVKQKITAFYIFRMSFFVVARNTELILFFLLFLVEIEKNEWLVFLLEKYRGFLLLGIQKVNYANNSMF